MHSWGRMLALLAVSTWSGIACSGEDKGNPQYACPEVGFTSVALDPERGVETPDAAVERFFTSGMADQLDVPGPPYVREVAVTTPTGLTPTGEPFGADQDAEFLYVHRDDVGIDAVLVVSNPAGWVVDGVRRCG